MLLTGMPPLDMHVTFMLTPSRYGPMVFSVIVAPWLSRIISSVGGTANEYLN